MPSTPRILRLPDGVRADLDDRIRSNGYGGYVALSEWLAATHRISISKTALGNYGKALMLTDAKSGASNRSHMKRAIASSTRRSGPGRLNELLLELGRLRLREHQILAELQALESTAVADCA